jgi:5-methylcytosine-specific restriction endonuclease McrA
MPLEGIDYIREQVRIRDKHTCQKCNKVWESGRRFDVHHLDTTMESIRDYSYDKANQDKLITLCHKCHLNLPHISRKLLTVPKKNMKRGKEICSLRDEGLSLEEIGSLYGVSWQRIQQILKQFQSS